MTNASIAAPAPVRTIDPREAAHFGSMAEDWWNPRGSSAMLHRLNPVRLRYIREQLDRHWGFDPAERRPLAGKRALDVGCGAGLLCEPLARLGADVTGVDAAEQAVAAARTHAAGQRLAVHYHAGELAELGGATFDLVTCLEVVEHVVDPAAFVAQLAHALAPGGLMILSTPNRTALSRMLVVTLAEGSGAIPRGTHDADRFLTPVEFEGLLEGAGLDVIDRRGLFPDAARGFTLSDDLRVNYLLTARVRSGPDRA